MATNCYSQCWHLHVEHHPLYQGSGPGDEAQADARAQNLGEGVEPDDAALGVQGEEAGRPRLGLLELEVEVGVVLEQDEVVLAAQLQDLPPPVQRQHSSWRQGRVT